MERKGGNPPNARAMADFNAFISDLRLINVEFNGPEFTWTNKKVKGEKISSRLDRFLISCEWLENWPESSVSHMKARGSDHLPIFLQQVPTSSPSKRLFRFDNRWLELQEVRELVLAVWSEPQAGLPMYKVTQKLKKIRHKLFSLMSSGMTNSAKKFKKIENAIDEEMSKEEPDWEIIATLESELAVEAHREAQYWKVRNRTKWLDLGDKRTKFFHHSVAQQRKRNTVKSLMDDNGNIQTSEERMGDITVSFYKALFETSNPPSGVHCWFPPQSHGRKVSNEMNINLTALVSNEEIREAIFDIGTDKAPGSDGFTSAFFQHYWDIIGREVTDAISFFFRSGRILKSINHTWISLLPKVKKVESMKQLRPIGLCSVLYKTISKILARRLGLVLPSIISPTQNGFVQG
ncbi:Transposon TX1 uncharacterized 149 kDa protein [Linum perenne]